jgi:hypothetical protein
MEKKGLTKKQFKLQLFISFYFVLFSAYFIISGILGKSAVNWGCGAFMLALSIAQLVMIVIQRKRHPIEDAQVDEQVTRNFKEGLQGAGIVLGLLVLTFLFAFGLAALLKG